MFWRLFRGAFMYLDGDNGGSGGGSSDPKTYDEAYVADLRKEAADYRTKHKDARLELETLKSTHTIVASENATLKDQIQEISLKSQVTDLLVAAGTTKPDAVFKLIRDQLKPGEDGKVEAKELQKIVDEAAKEYSELFSGKATSRQIDATQQNNNAPAGDVNKAIRRMAGRE